MIVVNNQFYFSCQSTYGLMSTTLNLTLLQSYGSQIGSYSALVYDLNNQIIYAANYNASSLDTFDINFNLLNTISLPNRPYAVNYYASRICVCYYNNANIAVIENGIVINTFTTQCPQFVGTLSVDTLGQILVPCQNTTTTYLYNKNVTYMNLYIKAGSINYWAGYDARYRLAITAINRIWVYY